MTPKYARLTSWSVRAAVAAGAAGVVADLAGARSVLVTVLVLVFFAVAPTAAIAGLLRGFDVFARLIIACVTAIAVITFIAMIMLAAGIWSPRGGLVAVALVSGACLLARRMGPITTKIAERATRIAGRARTVWMTLVDYWVVPGAEPTAAPGGRAGAAHGGRDPAAEACAGHDGSGARGGTGSGCRWPQRPRAGRGCRATGPGGRCRGGDALQRPRQRLRPQPSRPQAHPGQSLGQRIPTRR